MKSAVFFNKLLLILSCIVSFEFVGKAQTIIPAEMPVSYDVSPTGAFTYSLPIEIPPGIKNMMPQLAITYNSQSSNGLLGMGWSLSGLSTVTRTLPTIYHNGVIAPIDFDGNDMFALDGQRLLHTGTDGSGNKTYMTEIKNFSKITGHFGTSIMAPNYFTVEYPSGLTYEYGHTVDSKLLPNSNGHIDALIWAVNKIYDRTGNFISFNYLSDSAAGVFRITDIYYGNSSNPSLTSCHIYFHYVNRNDENTSWIYGSQLYDNKLLDYIEILDNSGDIENRYDFKYDVDPNTGDIDFYSHLIEIDETRTHPDRKLPPIKINWGKKDLSYSTPDFQIDSLTINYLQAPQKRCYAIGDYNGDGASDILYCPDFSGSHLTFYNNKDGSFGNLTGGVVVPVSNLDGGVVNDNNKLAFDFNGDGYDDWIVEEKNDMNGYGVYRLYVYLTVASSTGYHFDNGTCILEYSNNDTWHSPNPYIELIKQIRAIPGDFDGDGKKDLILMFPTGYFWTTNTKVIVPNNYACFLVSDVLPMDTPPTPIQIGNDGSLNYGKMRWIGTLGFDAVASVALDYNGDGKDDLLLTQNAVGLHQSLVYNIDVSYSGGVSNPSGTMSLIQQSNFPNVGHKFVRTGDFNGDGKADLLTWGPVNGNNQWNIAYSTGYPTGNTWDIEPLPAALDSYLHTNCPFPEESNNQNSSWTIQIADFNGDGKDDIVQFNRHPISTSTGDATYDMFYARGYQYFIHESSPPNTYLPIDFIPQGWNNSTGTWDTRPTLLTGDFNGDGQVDLMATMLTRSLKFVSFHPKDIRHLATSIEHAGKRIDIAYSSLAEKNAPYEFVPWTENGHTQTEYPYISRQFPIKVVSSLKDNISMYNTYKYETLSLHLTGLGFQGFHKAYIKDSTANRMTVNEYSLFPFYNIGSDYSRSQLLVKTGLYNLDDSGNITDTISKKTSHWGDIAGDPSGIVRIIRDYDDIETNYALGTYHNTYQGFSSSSGPGSMFYELGQIDSLYEDFGVHGGYNNATKRFAYDTSAPFYCRSNPISIVSQTTYAGQPTYIRREDYRYNAITGLLDSVIADPGTSVQNIITHQYDAYGNDSLKILYAGNLTPRMNSYQYSSDGRFMIKSRSYMNSYVYEDSTDYNHWGKPVYHKGINGLETFYEYDAVNRLTYTKLPEGVITRKEYDWAYNNSTDNPSSAFTDYHNITANQSAAQFYVKTTTDNITGASYTFNDFRGKKLRETSIAFDGSVIYKDVIYTSTGLPYQSKSAYPKNNASLAITTTYYYDKFDRDSLETSSSGPTIRTSYVASVLPAFLKSTVTNTSVSPAHVKTTYQDAGGVYLVEDNGNSIGTQYNSNGHPDNVMINGNPLLKTEYTYDSFGRVLTKKEPNCGTTLYTYDALSQIHTEEIPAGTGTVVYTYEFDDLGKLKSKTDNDPNQTHAFTYFYNDAPGLPWTNLLSLASSTYGTNTDISYTYDQYARLIDENKNVMGTSFDTHYSYDLQGRQEVITYPDNNNYQLQNTYNQYGFLESKSIQGQGIQQHTLWRINAQNHLGQTTQAEYDDQNGNPVYTIYSGFDLDGYPTTKQIYSVIGSLGSLISSMEYGFDKYTGNLNYREDILKGFKEDFTYDIYDRLETVTPTGFSANSLAMQYDDDGSSSNVSVGNIVKKSDITSTLYKWKYSGYALQTIADDTGGSVPLSSVRLPNIQTLDYYPFKKVRYIAEANGDSLAFSYDSQEMRSQVDYFDNSLAAYKTRYYSDNYERTIDRVNFNTEDKTSYLNADGELIALIQEKTGMGAHPPAISFVLTDHLGSITHILREDGSGISEERSFDAWGRPRDPATWQHFTPSTAPLWTIDRGYTGHEHIWLTGAGYDNAVINMNGRLYDPMTARMFSPDPLLIDASSSQAYNKYSYVNDNPLKYIDPTGNASQYYSSLGGITVSTVRQPPANNYSPSTGTQLLQVAILLAAAYIQPAIMNIDATGATAGLGYYFGEATMGAVNYWMANGPSYRGMVSAGLQRGFSSMAGMMENYGSGDLIEGISGTDDYDPREFFCQSLLIYDGQKMENGTGTEGELTWWDLPSNGSDPVKVDSWDAMSGSRTLGPIPSGEWALSNFRNRRKDEHNGAFWRDGVGFSVDITPDPKYGRSSLRIHPDGNKPGSEGCIGLRENGDRLRQFSHMMKGYLRQHNIMRLIVKGNQAYMHEIRVTAPRLNSR